MSHHAKGLLAQEQKIFNPVSYKKQLESQVVSKASLARQAKITRSKAQLGQQPAVNTSIMSYVYIKGSNQDISEMNVNTLIAPSGLGKYEKDGDGDQNGSQL